MTIQQMPESRQVGEFNLLRGHSRESYGSKNTSVAFFKNAQWSPDGTSIVSNSSDNTIRTFVIPPDLLDERPAPQILDLYSAIQSPEPIDAIALYPYFDLQDPSTNLALAAVNEHPIQLSSTATAHLVASYPLISTTTESYLKPNSLLFSSDGREFLAGSENCVSIFDISRPGQGPVTSLQTGPKKANSYTNPATSMRGRVSALAVDQQHGVLAAATYTRHVGLYDAAGRGDCLGAFCLAGTEADASIRGQGITQVSWSHCGRYLFIAERRSDGMLFYDIRNSGQLLGWTTGRAAETNQRMDFSLSQNTQTGTMEIWAGGTDGCVRMWKGPTNTEGSMAATTQMHLHTDAVNSIDMHRMGSVLATASGQRHFDDVVRDSAIKIWDMSIE